MKKIRVLTLGLVAVCVLAWALPATAHRSSAKAAVVTVTAGKPSEFHFTVSTTSVPHGTVTFNVTSQGTLPHNFTINGKTTKLLSQGQSQKLVVTFAKAGKYPFMCTVTGHAAAGMKGTLTVT
jgi:plastocyanin